MRLDRASLAKPPTWILIGDGSLTPEKKEWAQQGNEWLAIYYHHVNAVTINTTTFKVEPDDIVIFAPGVRAAHAVVGPDKRFDFIGFDLPGGRSEIYAIPALHRNMRPVFRDLRRASERVVDTTTAAFAFVWNFMWSVAQPISLLRDSERMYLAESFIRQNLRRRITVGEIGEYAGLSPRQLLREFRTEHGVSVQEFVLRTRIREASRLLLDTQLPIKEIAGRVGYVDLQEFNKVIRTALGLSPRAFRQLQKREGGHE